VLCRAMRCATGWLCLVRARELWFIVMAVHAFTARALLVARRREETGEEEDMSSRQPLDGSTR
jgi:hypothetical protein